MISSLYRGKLTLSLLLLSMLLLNSIMLLVCPAPILAARSTSSAKTSLVSKAAPASEAILSKVSKAYDQLPMGFEENVGQHSDTAVKYLSRARNYDLALGTSEAVFTLRNAGADGDHASRKASRISAPPAVLRMKSKGKVDTLGPSTEKGNLQ